MVVTDLPPAQTHNVAMVSPVADFVVSLGLDGRVVSQGTQVSDALKANSKLRAQVAETSKITEKEAKAEEMEGTEEPKAEKPTGQLVAKEEILEGRVGWTACQFFSHSSYSFECTKICFQLNSSLAPLVVPPSGSPFRSGLLWRSSLTWRRPGSLDTGPGSIPNLWKSTFHGTLGFTHSSSLAVLSPGPRRPFSITTEPFGHVARSIAS